MRYPPPHGRHTRLDLLACPGARTPRWVRIHPGPRVPRSRLWLIALAADILLSTRTQSVAQPFRRPSLHAYISMCTPLCTSRPSCTPFRALASWLLQLYVLVLEHNHQTQPLPLRMYSLLQGSFYCSLTGLRRWKQLKQNQNTINELCYYQQLITHQLDSVRVHVLIILCACVHK